MSLSINQQAALEKASVSIIYFAEFNFLTASVYVCSLGQTVNWNGRDWVGVGAVGSITAIEEKQGTAASALDFQLNITQPEWLALSVRDVVEYRGRDAKLYFCPLNEGFGLIDTPQICWRGTMDTITSSISGKQGEATGTITLRCETSAHGLKRKPALRLNAAQQKQRYPGDTGFDYLISLISVPQPWLSVRFQRL